MSNNPVTVTLPDCDIAFRNFEGREGQYNRAGDRNFCIILDHDTADKMSADGWNIKTLKSKDDPEDHQPYIQVTVGGNGKGRAPRIVIVTSQGRTDLTEDLFDIIDYTDIKNADVILRAFDWGPINGKSGRKAYLKSLWIFVDEDELALKYEPIIPVANAVPSRLEIEMSQNSGDIIDGELVEN